MRVLILTDGSERHVYFCARLVRETGCVVGIISNGKEINRSKLEEIKNSFGKYPLKTLEQRFYQRVYRHYGNDLKKEKKLAEKTFFAKTADDFSEAFQNLIISEVNSSDRSLNDHRFIKLIHDLKPDVIAVMGTCILGKAILQSAPLILNMHTGLSPYYRGGRTNFWPFVENEAGYFGVTVHKMSTGIDTGDIVYSARIPVERNDTFGSINCKSIVLGTDLMIKALKHAKAGTMKALPQWQEGKIFYDRDWTFKAAKTYFANREALIVRQLLIEEQGGFSNIKTVQNGELAVG